MSNNFVIIFIPKMLTKRIRRRYCVTIYVGVFPYPILVCFQFSVLHRIPALYADLPAFYPQFSRYHIPRVITHAQCVNGVCGGVGGEGVGWVRMGGVEAFLALWEKLSLHEIYCAKPIPDYGYQYGSLSYRGLGKQALWIIRK